VPLIEAQRSLILLGHFEQQGAATRFPRLPLCRVEQHGAKPIIAIRGIDRERVHIKARRRPFLELRERPQALAQPGKPGRLAPARETVTQHHAGDMPAEFADHRVFQAERFASVRKTAGGEIDQLAAPGLSGEAGRRIAGLDDQFGEELTFTLARQAQNGLLLTKSILEMHRGPETGCGKAWCCG
jgi:hypothetical protein